MMLPIALVVLIVAYIVLRAVVLVLGGAVLIARIGIAGAVSMEGIQEGSPLRPVALLKA